MGKIFLYGFCLGLFFLTEYYSLLLGAFIFIAIAYKSIAKKSIESFKQLIILFFIAFTTVLLVCPLYFINFKSICHMSETIEASNIWNFVFFHWHGIYLLKFLSKFIFNNIVFF